MAESGFGIGFFDDLAGCFAPGAFEAIERELGLASPDETLRWELLQLLLEHCWRDNRRRQLKEAALADRFAATGEHARGLAEALRPFETASPGSAAYAEIAALEPALQAAGVDVGHLIATLDTVGAVASAHECKPGRPPAAAWQALMVDLAAIYERRTGRRAAANRDKHKEIFAGPFVRIAALVDMAAARVTGTEPRGDAALGRALERLLKPRAN